jgi:hypothetical protein
MLNYIAFIIIIIIFYVAYTNISRIKVVNNELKILQTFDPDETIIKELLEKHQPIIIQRELFFWKQFNKTILGQSLDIINQEIGKNKEVNYTTIIKENLNIYNLPLSYDWNIDIRNISLDYNSAIFFTKQNNYMQLFACVNGEMKIIISPPDQFGYLEPFNNLISTIDATSIINKEPPDMKYIEIIIRKGNMIFVPWGWFYFIYNSKPEQECVIIDCLNKSALSIL